MNKSNLMYLVVTDEVDSKTFTPRGKDQITINFQICDLYSPDRRHPVDYELSYFQPQDMLPPGIYYPSHESFTVGKYGLEPSKYPKWISAQDLKEELELLIKNKPAELKAAS